MADVYTTPYQTSRRFRNYLNQNAATSGKVTNPDVLDQILQNELSMSSSKALAARQLELQAKEQAANEEYRKAALALQKKAMPDTSFLSQMTGPATKLGTTYLMYKALKPGKVPVDPNKVPIEGTQTTGQGLTVEPGYFDKTQQYVKDLWNGSQSPRMTPYNPSVNPSYDPSLFTGTEAFANNVAPLSYNFSGETPFMANESLALGSEAIPWSANAGIGTGPALQVGAQGQFLAPQIAGNAPFMVSEELAMQAGSEAAASAAAQNLAAQEAMTTATQTGVGSAVGGSAGIGATVGSVYNAVAWPLAIIAAAEGIRSGLGAPQKAVSDRDFNENVFSTPVFGTPYAFSNEIFGKKSGITKGLKHAVEYEDEAIGQSLDKFFAGDILGGIKQSVRGITDLPEASFKSLKHAFNVGNYF